LPDEIHLTVKDSGVGFDRDAAKTSLGLGSSVWRSD
jgi:signal transduction histidine kinase